MSSPGPALALRSVNLEENPPLKQQLLAGLEEPLILAPQTREILLNLDTPGKFPEEKIQPQPGSTAGLDEAA